MTTLNRVGLKGLIFFSFFLVTSQSAADAELLENTCNLVYQKLASGPHESLTNSFANFEDESTPHYGCVMRLNGNAQRVTDSQNPEGLFGQPLPYCPNGEFPADSPREFINRDGWCSDKNADGPDGTSYRAIKKNVFCLVEGRWDGGDSDPKYVPSPKYEVIVRCGNR
jgi:hypothetical protein